MREEGGRHVALASDHNLTHADLYLELICARYRKE
jgi:hypothetical protein